MVHARFHFPSRFLGRNTDFHVLLPKPQTPFYDDSRAGELREKKCLWFFHGIGDDAETVLLQTDIAALCDELDLVVILPSVENSFCLDVNGSLLFRSYLLEELLPFTMRMFSLSPLREKHLIGGISMGGYGACHLALRQPEFFSRVFCLSGALDPTSAARYGRVCGIPLAAPLDTKETVAATRDWDLLTHLDALYARGAVPPEICLRCSELDSVYKTNVRLVRRAEELGFPAELHTAPGLHDWNFWRENLGPALKWAVR